MTIGQLKAKIANIPDDVLVISTIGDGWIGLPVSEISYDFLHDIKDPEMIVTDTVKRDFYPSANASRTEPDLAPPKNVGAMERVIVIHNRKFG